MGAEIEKKKAIGLGPEELKEKEDLLKPRDMKPGDKITDLKVVDGKVQMVKQGDSLRERDAEEFDGLLNDLPTPIDTKPIQVSKKATDTKPIVMDIQQATTSSTGMEGTDLVIKRSWAKKAENDLDEAYDGYRRFKGLDSLKDIVKWTKENVLNFEDGKMYETLFSNDDLFNNPGLAGFPGAADFRSKVMNGRSVLRKNNSQEIGFMVVARAIIKDVFKEKCRGLVLRNLQVKADEGNHKQMRMEFGKFLDKIVEQADKQEGGFGRMYLDLDRFSLERIKNENLQYTTDNKTGTYIIQVSSNVIIVHIRSRILFCSIDL